MPPKAIRSRNNSNKSSNSSQLNNGSDLKSSGARLSSQFSGSGFLHSSTTTSKASHDDEVLFTNIKARTEQMLSSFEMQIKSMFDSLESKLLSFTTSMNKQFEDIGKMILHLEQRCDQLAADNEELFRITRATDVIIRGIPTLPNEEPRKIVDEISNALQHQLSSYTQAFRVKNTRKRKGNQNGNSATSHDMPIVVRFSCSNEQKAFLSAFRLRKFLKLNELSGLEFSSDSRVYVNESLTPKNNQLLREALKLLRNRTLHSVFTNNGFVYVRRNADGDKVRITNLDQLRPLSVS